jgi:Glycosyl transferase family 2
MKLVMTLLVRDEEDVIDAQIAFHLHAGVDVVIATDNRSQDGTTEILERNERAGVLHLLREDGDDMRQDEWVTRMAPMAASDFGADWVINSDADEFWWTSGGSLKDVLATVPERYGVVRGCWRHYLPRPDDGAFFGERMVVRLNEPAFSGDKRTVLHAHQKIAHRADPEVEVERGNHNAHGRGTASSPSGLAPARGVALLHALPCAARSEGGRRLAPRRARGDAPPGDAERGPAREPHPRALRLLAVTDDLLQSGLANGALAVDTLRVGSAPFAIPTAPSGCRHRERRRRSHSRGRTCGRTPPTRPGVRARRDRGDRPGGKAGRGFEDRVATLEGNPLARWS